MNNTFECFHGDFSGGRIKLRFGEVGAVTERWFGGGSFGGVSLLRDL